MYHANTYQVHPIYPVLNLHLFDNTQTTGTSSPGNDLSPEMKTYYHDRLIDNAEPALIHDQFAEKYPIPANGGKVIEFRRYSPLPKALTKLTEGVTPSGNKLNVTALTAEIDQYGDYIEMSDVLQFTAIDRNIEEATKLLGSQSGRTLDTVSREVVNGGTNKMFAPSVASNGVETPIFLREDVTPLCKLTPKVVRKAVASLKRMNALPREGGDYVAIIHSDVTCDITGDKEWIEAHKYAAPENIFSGEIGRIGNCRFVETTEAKVIGPAWIFGNDISGTNRLHVKEIEATGTTQIVVKEAISAAQASEFNARIAGGETIKLYFGGNAMVATACTAGAAGAGYFTVAATTVALAANDLICGYGAGKDGSAIYCTVFIGANAYGTTSAEGLGLQHIVKQLGSAGSSDALNQRSTTGWKATKVTERLVEEYMIRVEHSNESFGASANSN